jgi:hypothetical protein
MIAAPPVRNRRPKAGSKATKTTKPISIGGSPRNVRGKARIEALTTSIDGQKHAAACTQHHADDDFSPMTQTPPTATRRRRIESPPTARRSRLPRQ